MRRLLPVLVCLWGAAGAATATTIHVPGGRPTIQAGLDAASPGDTVCVARGTYYEHSITMSSGVYLTSETGTKDCVTIDARQEGRVLYCSATVSSASIVGFTITGGEVSDGAGMYCSSSSLAIIDCAFVGNYAHGYGGGLYCPVSSPSVVGCTFRGNQGTAGGGGTCCPELASPTLTECQFLGNFSYCGAGLYCGSSSSPTVSSCTFVGNEAISGAGVYCKVNSSPTLVSCTFVGNDAHEHGSGLYSASSSSPTLTGCIIASGESGGAIFCDGVDSTPQLMCCDVYGNVGGDWEGCTASQAGVDANLSEDPLFCDAPNGDWTLDASSPCSAANNPSCLLIGAWDVGCDSPVRKACWGAIKATYR